jgi:hypothetical protein
MGNLSSVGINLYYTKGLAADYHRYHREPHPSSYAMVWCMLATGFDRIFTREDMKEFLFRLPIALHSQDLVETWLMNDRLMNYTVKGKDYTLTLEDVVMHFGLEVIDSYRNQTSRESFLSSVGNRLFTSMFIGEDAGFAVIKPEMRDNETLASSIARHVPEITDELIAKAEFFASDLMKFIPEETFTERNPLIEEKEKEIEERHKKIRNIPVFNIKKIPKKIIRQCLETMFTMGYAERLLKDPVLFDKEARPLIYLGWLLANDMMEYVDGGWLQEKEGVHLDYWDYELPDGGSNLNITVGEYNLNELAPILKGI